MTAPVRVPVRGDEAPSLTSAERAYLAYLDRRRALARERGAVDREAEQLRGEWERAYAVRSRRTRQGAGSHIVRAITAPVDEFMRSAETGINETEARLVKGVARLAGSERLHDAAERTRRRRRARHEPTGRAGAAGEFVGNVLGEGALTLLGGRAIGAATTALAPASRIQQAITAGALGTRARVALAQTARNAPVDVALGAGTAEQGESPLARGAIAAAFGAAGALARGGTRTLAAPIARATAEQPERVVAAAVRTRDGRVFQGAWHAQALEVGREATGKRLRLRPPDGRYRVAHAVDEGFVTSAGRFVSREEAAQIAKRARQAPGLAFEPGFPLSSSDYGEVAERRWELLQQMAEAQRRRGGEP